MKRHWFFVSAMVALGTWGCSSSGQSSDDSGANSGGASANAGHGGNSGSTNASDGGGTSANSGGSTGTNSGGNGAATAGDSGTSGGGANVAGSSAGGGSAGAGTVLAACNNGIDDDGDGLIDGFDPECTNPSDNDEGSFATGIPGDNRDPKWQDCFFDGNSGAGDDDCRYATGCLTGELPQTDANCALTDACVKFCAPLTQNGCDCFGCCTIQKADGTTVDIAENASCSLANLDDTAACPRCTKNTQCGDSCGECELCPGKTVADLPASCTPSSGTGGSGSVGGASGTGGSSVGGAAQGSGGSTGTGGGATWSCDGRQVCGPNLPCQGSSEYCSLGCCIVVVR